MHFGNRILATCLGLWGGEERAGCKRPKINSFGNSPIDILPRTGWLLVEVTSSNYKLFFLSSYITTVVFPRKRNIFPCPFSKHTKLYLLARIMIARIDIIKGLIAELLRSEPSTFVSLTCWSPSVSQTMCWVGFFVDFMKLAFIAWTWKSKYSSLALLCIEWV